MPVTSIGWLHTALAFGALAVGAAVAFDRKGTARHRWLGRIYGGLILAVNGTAFMMYELFGRVGPFHCCMRSTFAQAGPPRRPAADATTAALARSSYLRPKGA